MLKVTATLFSLATLLATPALAAKTFDPANLPKMYDSLNASMTYYANCRDEMKISLTEAQKKQFVENLILTRRLAAIRLAAQEDKNEEIAKKILDDIKSGSTAKVQAALGAKPCDDKIFKGSTEAIANFANLNGVAYFTEHLKVKIKPAKLSADKVNAMIMGYLRKQ
jgi:hypothetical protein